jgi:hypothetical protein
LPKLYRKPFLLCNLFILAVTYLSYILLHTAGLSLGPQQTIYVFYGISGLYGLSGGAFNFCLMVFSYVGDLSSLQPETRLRRFTLSEASGTSSLIVGRVFKTTFREIFLSFLHLLVQRARIKELRCTTFMYHTNTEKHERHEKE